MPLPSSLVLLVAGLMAPPAVTSLSPAAAAAGGAGFTLTVTGSEFRHNAVVLWNGAERPTTWESETRLRAAIAAADIAGPGTVEIRVRTRGSKGGRSEPVSFTVTGTATNAGTAPANPVPSIASLAPATAPAGAEGLRLVVSGGGFVTGAAVWWNGGARPTTRHSSTQLSALLTAADLAAVGSARVGVLNPAPGGGYSAEQVMRILHAAPVIASLTPATVVAGSGDLAVTIAGQSFLSTAQVYWNNLPRSTTYVGPAALRVTIPAADLRAAGAGQVTVVTTVGQSAMRSAPAQFVISLPPQQTVPATVQLVIDRFHVGGATNPAWVTAGQAAPLHWLATGAAPTHYRAAENAQLSGAEWRTVAAPAYTFAAGTTGSRTLWFQARYGEGTSASLSGIVSDAVEVVPPYSTAGIEPERFGVSTAERVRLLCPAGQVLTGIHGDSGLWLDNVGVECAGRKGPYAYLAVHGGLVGPVPFEMACAAGAGPGAVALGTAGVWNGFLTKPYIACTSNPAGILLGFDVARAEAVAGERELFEDGVHCPDGSFPVGLDVYLNRMPVTGQRGVGGLGLFCARMRP